MIEKYSSLPDDALVELVKEQDSNAFEELIGRYSEKAFHLATRYTRNREDAEEVLQDVFTTVYRKIGSFEGKSSFSSWFYRITVNTGLMKLRKRRQDRTVAAEDILPEVSEALLSSSDPVENTEYSFLRQELFRNLKKAIHDLPEDYRIVFVLRDIDGLTSPEVSEALAISTPAVKSRLHRARALVKQSMSKTYGENDEDYEAPLKAVGDLF